MADIASDKQTKIVFYLGYSAKTLVDNSTSYNRIIQKRMTNLSVDTIAMVDSLLALIEETRTKLDATRDDSNVTRVGEIGLSPDHVDVCITKQYKRYIRELGTLLDIPVAVTGGGSVGVRW